MTSASLHLLQGGLHSPPASDGAGWVATTGSPGAVLLAGPPPGEGAETLEAHRARLPGSGRPLDAATAFDLVTRIAVAGRGGGGFPMAAKLAAARSAEGTPLVVVNASESEPASAKDEALCRFRPHLILDGAAVVAAAAGTGQVVVQLHRSAAASYDALARARDERVRSASGGPEIHLVRGPDRYVAGESSAVAAYLAGGEALPEFSPVPLAQGRPGRRPVLVHNAESLAHVGLAAAIGAEEWARTGPAGGRGSRLVTVWNDSDEEGQVFEVVGDVTFHQLLAAHGRVIRPSALLVGGYSGTWVRAADAWGLTVSDAGSHRLGAGLGCGLVVAISEETCGLDLTARLAAYLEGESAGQCGPCVFGLADLERTVRGVLRGRSGAAAARRVDELIATVSGRGACRHPDAALSMVRSALSAFTEEIADHRRRAGCPRRHATDLPIPARDGVEHR